MKLSLISLLILFLSVSSCKNLDSDPSKQIISVSSTSLALSYALQKSDVTVKMTGSKWTATTDQAWCSLSISSSTSKQADVTISVTANNSFSARTAKVTFTLNNNDTVSVKVSQSALPTIPDYSNPVAADPSGMSSSIQTLAHNINIGWNLGNTMEVPFTETGWGNPITTPQLINGIKAAGFNAIRIPCAWDSYTLDSLSYKINPVWLLRVKQVIDDCYKNNMYVILNIHWDGGWLENHPQYAYQEKANAKQKAYWQQIAVYFRDYDEHLLFAGTNEVHHDYNTPSAENIAVQQSYNQTFVNAVRSTGGKNAYRALIVQSYNTNIGYAVSYLKMPDDTASKRLLVEVHYYDPWDFTGDTGSSAVTLWGTSYASFGKISSWGQEDYLKTQFASMKTNFVDKGYPVILGEFGAIRRSSLTGATLTNHLASRAYYLGYVTQHAKNYGLVPFYWDNGVTSNGGFGLINRIDGSVFDSHTLNALMTGASLGSYPY
jgi:endoglucanase